MEGIDTVEDRMQSKQTPEETSKAVKTEEYIGLNSCLLSSAGYPIVSSRSRKHLTEDEKEARRVRRVLANRESARQTIRRRQAMLAELTQRSADLELENENLKRVSGTFFEFTFTSFVQVRNVVEFDTYFDEFMQISLIDEKERELAAHEYSSLKSTNDCLKDQINEMMRDEVVETEEKLPPNSESFTSASLTAPCIIFNQSPVVPSWPSFPQASEASAAVLQPESGVATLVPMAHMWMPSFGQGNPVMVSNPGNLFYMLPFSFLCPFNAPTSTHHVQTSELNDRQSHTLIHQPDGSCSSRTTIRERNGESSFPLKPKLEAASSGRNTIAGEEAGSSLSAVGGGEDDSLGFKRMVVEPAPPTCVRPIASVRPFTSLQGDCSGSEAVGSVSCHGIDTMSERNERPSQKPAEADAAIEARKRRKELM